MGTAQASSDAAAHAAAGTAVPMRYEVTVVPVADTDRAKEFYQSLGWRLDADFPVDEHDRVVQFTPPDSPTSIQFGTGTSTMTPGSLQDMMLAVEDINAAREDLVSRGVDVSEVWHGRRGPGTQGRIPGPDPDRTSYGSYASFTDPDGNGFLLQEVTQRLPGRVWPTDSAARAQLLREAAEHHDSFEEVAPPHDWWDWYAAYLDARERGDSPEQASAAAGRYMAEVKHIVVTRT